MKKIKLMLTAITVFAVVGGALAFKAAKYSDTIFCSDSVVDKALCQDVIPHATFTEQSGTNYFCTTNGAKCDLEVITAEN